MFKRILISSLLAVAGVSALALTGCTASSEKPYALSGQTGDEQRVQARKDDKGPYGMDRRYGKSTLLGYPKALEK